MTRKTRKPRLTNKVIAGIIAATSEILAGDPDANGVGRTEIIERADEWARAMRAYRDESVAAESNRLDESNHDA